MIQRTPIPESNYSI